MAERVLVSINLETVPDVSEDILPFKIISYVGGVYFSVKPNTLDSAYHFLLRDRYALNTYIDATAVERVSDVILLLDKGAAKVVITLQQLKKIIDDCLLEDLGRLIVFNGHSATEKNVDLRTDEFTKHLDSIAGHAAIEVYVQEEDDFRSLSDLPKTQRDCYAIIGKNNRGVYRAAIANGYIPVVSATDLELGSTSRPDDLAFEGLLTEAIKSDRTDGLYSTVVTNELGVCLGLVYSSKESIKAALQTGTGVYHSRRRGLWYKGAESGDTQELVSIRWDCDGDALRFVVRQKGDGFCHLKTSTCFGPYTGLAKLEKTLQSRKKSAPPNSYTARLFNDTKLLWAKIMEEASELCEAQSKTDVAAEAADLIYFAMAKCVASGTNLQDVERNLDRKSLKTSRRKGDAKSKWAEKVGLTTDIDGVNVPKNAQEEETIKEAASVPKSQDDPAGINDGRIQMKRYKTLETEPAVLKDALQRPSQRSTEEIMKIVRPIIQDVRDGGDASVLAYTHKFEKATSLTTPVLRSPFPLNLMQLPQETIDAIDISFENIRRFHSAQKEEKPLEVETMPGVMCSRFSRPIERVGLYVPGGTAVLPSTALMLGVPALVAGCKNIVLASPPRSDGTITPEIVYVAHKIGAESIVLAGGAQAVAAMAYGTPSITKVDKILGPGNQFVTAAKMLVSNDTTACVSIDMPAGPSEVLVIADRTANPAFVASDLLSQAEHGTDSQVVLIAVALNEEQLHAIEVELNAQAHALPRVDIVRGAIEHSVTLVVGDIIEAMALSNQYAPEHLILQVEGAERVVGLVENAGSVFVGPWTPESVGDYSAGVNHSLPTYGYAKQYSGVSLSSFTKHITSSHLTQQGLRNVGAAVMRLAAVEELEAHRRAVSVRLEWMDGDGDGGEKVGREG